MSDRHSKERLLKYFNFSEPDNISGSLTLPLNTTAETALATVRLEHIRSNDRVLLQATVGWLVATTAVQNTEIRFRLRRDGALGTIVFDTIDSAGTTAVGRRYTTSFVHSETGVTNGTHTYTLSAITQTGLPSQLVVTGPVDLNGSVIDENDT